MKVKYKEKTTFITPYDVFYYTMMPFGLKYAHATNQRCMQYCLREQIGRNVQVHVNDIVIITKHNATLLDSETFDNLICITSS
jgi:hypothetical protein